MKKKRFFFIVLIGLLGLAASEDLYAVKCSWLLAYVNENLSALKIKEQTPLENLYDGRGFDIMNRVQTVCREKAKTLGLEEVKASPAIDEAGFVAYELYKNASMWGNKYNPKKSITVEVHFDKDGILVSVQDQGEKAFEPYADPGSFREEEETEEAFMQRRKEIGKEVKNFDSHGLFWAGQKIVDPDYAYQFNEGSTVVVKVPWNHVRPW